MRQSSFSPSTSSSCRSTTNVRTVSRSRCSRARSSRAAAPMTTFPGSCSSKVGPGLRPRVRSRPSSPTWLERALEDYRVLLLDQRGTGRSTPVGALEGMSAQEQADYPGTSARTGSCAMPAHSRRARDRAVERSGTELRRLLRHALLVGFSGRPGRGLSDWRAAASRGSPGRHLPGDVPPGARPEPLVLRALSRGSRARPQRRRAPRCGGSEAPVGRPSDVMPLSRAREHARHERRLRAAAHIVELPVGSPAFVHDVEGMATLAFGRNPIYAVLHEACYGQGYATKWSAERTLPTTFARIPRFSPASTSIRGCSRTSARSVRCATLHICSRSTCGRSCTTFDAWGKRRAGGRGRLCERPLRRARVFRGGGRGDSRAPHVGHERVRARRLARGRLACVGAPDRSRSRRRLVANGDDDALHGVVRVAAEVPGRIDRLLASGLVACAAEELVAPGRARLPDECPWRPGPRALGRTEGCRVPRLAVVADVDARDRAPARPRATLDRAGTGLDDPFARQVLGNPGAPSARAGRCASTARLLRPLPASRGSSSSAGSRRKARSRA